MRKKFHNLSPKPGSDKRNRDSQSLKKYKEAENGEAYGKHYCVPPFEPMTCVRADNYQKRERDHKSAAAKSKPEQNSRSCHQQRPFYCKAADRTSLLNKRPNKRNSTNKNQKTAQDKWEIGRPHFESSAHLIITPYYYGSCSEGYIDYAGPEVFRIAHEHFLYERKLLQNQLQQ
jgi:hypothetical protein